MNRAYKPTKRVLAYIRSMISKKTWRVNHRVPRIADISSTLSVSQPTVRKAIRMLEKEGVLENFGSLGFYVKSDYGSQRNKYWTGKLKDNVKIAELLGKGGVQIGRFVLRYIPATQNVTAIDVVSGKTRKASLTELTETVERPLDLDQVLKSSAVDTTKKKWERQKDLQAVAQIVSRHKKELGINGK